MKKFKMQTKYRHAIPSMQSYKTAQVILVFFRENTDTASEVDDASDKPLKPSISTEYQPQLATISTEPLTYRDTLLPVKR
jgi:hypothetical protein